MKKRGTQSRRRRGGAGFANMFMKSNNKWETTRRNFKRSHPECNGNGMNYTNELEVELQQHLKSYKNAYMRNHPGSNANTLRNAVQREKGAFFTRKRNSHSKKCKNNENAYVTSMI